MVNGFLPSYERVPVVSFMWGDQIGVDVSHAVECAYAEAVHWRRNVFLVPSGKISKAYVKEQSRLFFAYTESTVMESIALKATMLMPLLLLQKPHIASKSKEHVQCLERRLKQWKEGDINGLVREG